MKFGLNFLFPRAVFGTLHVQKGEQSENVLPTRTSSFYPVHLGVGKLLTSEHYKERRYNII